MSLKVKILFSVFTVLFLINIVFSFYLFKKNSELESNVSSINHQLYRLDLGALEKIKSEPKEFNFDEDCGSGMLQIPCE